MPLRGLPALFGDFQIIFQDFLFFCTKGLKLILLCRLYPQGIKVDNQMRLKEVTYSNITYDAKDETLFGIVTFVTTNGPLHVECAIQDYVPSAHNTPRTALRRIAQTKLRFPAILQAPSTYHQLISRAA